MNQQSLTNTNDSSHNPRNEESNSAQCETELCESNSHNEIRTETPIEPKDADSTKAKHEEQKVSIEDQFFDSFKLNSSCSVCRSHKKIGNAIAKMTTDNPFINYAIDEESSDSDNDTISPDCLHNYREGAILNVDPYGEAKLLIVCQDIAVGGESTSIDVGIYADEDDSKICIAKTIPIRECEISNFQWSPTIDSNEPEISNVMTELSHNDRLHLLVPFMHYDREKVYKRSNISRMMRMSDQGTKYNYVTILSDYINGHDLSMLITKHPNRLDEEFVIKIIKSIWSGIKAMHRNRIVHSDLKPSNIMIDDDTHKVSIIDFGKSTHFPKAIKNDDAKVERRRVMKRSYSTPSYISASLLLDGNLSNVTSRDAVRTMMMMADVWSYGMIVYELMVHEPYYARYVKNKTPFVLGAIMKDMEENLTPGTSIDLSPEMEIIVNSKIIRLIKHCATYRPRTLAETDIDYVELMIMAYDEISQIVDSL